MKMGCLQLPDPCVECNSQCHQCWWGSCSYCGSLFGSQIDLGRIKWVYSFSVLYENIGTWQTLTTSDLRPTIPGSNSHMYSHRVFGSIEALEPPAVAQRGPCFGYTLKKWRVHIWCAIIAFTGIRPFSNKSFQSWHATTGMVHAWADHFFTLSTLD